MTSWLEINVLTYTGHNDHSLLNLLGHQFFLIIKSRKLSQRDVASPWCACLGKKK